MLDKQRSLAARTSSAPGAGKSPVIANWTNCCKGTRTDPTYPAHEMPIHMYATAWWESWVPRDIMEHAHEKTAAAFESAKFAWNAAKGPFAATILSARRIGWSFKSASVLVTDVGEEINLARDSPVYVRDRTREAVSRKIAKEIDEALPALQSGGRGPMRRGVRRALRKAKELSKVHPQWLGKFSSERPAIRNQ